VFAYTAYSTVLLHSIKVSLHLTSSQYTTSSERETNEHNMLLLGFLDTNTPEAVVITLIAAIVTTILLFALAPDKSPPQVCELNIYPIKSCAAIRVKEAVATDRGFENDRIAQVSNVIDGNKYCTPRDRKYSKLFHVKVEIKDTSAVNVTNANNKKTTLVLSSPDAPKPMEVNLAGKTKAIMAVPMVGPKVKLQDYGDAVAKWLERITSVKGCRLTGIGAGYTRIVEVNPDQGDAVPTAEDASISLADEAPYLLTSTTSLAALNKRLKANGQLPVDMRRFRPNIVISGLKPWQEDAISKIRIGSVDFYVWQRCGRCTMTTIDRDSLERGPEPLATLNTFRERAGQRNFGMHLVPVMPIAASAEPMSFGLGMPLRFWSTTRREKTNGSNSLVSLKSYSTLVFSLKCFYVSRGFL
jgi:uncharacterized protein YcbX